MVQLLKELEMSLKTMFVVVDINGLVRGFIDFWRDE